MKQNKHRLSTMPKWFILIPSILILVWSLWSQINEVEYHLAKHKHIDTAASISSVLLIYYASFHYTISRYSVTMRFWGIPVKRIYWNRIAGVIVFDSIEDSNSITALLVHNSLDFSTVTRMTTEQLQHGKWKNSMSLTIPRERLNEFSNLVRLCGKELIMR